MFWEDGTMSKGRPFTSDVLWGLVLGPVLFNIFINDLDSRQCTHSKFADLFIRKLGGVSDVPKAMLPSIDRLERWADRNLMLFNKWKFKKQEHTAGKQLSTKRT